MGALASYPGSLSHREPGDEASGCSCMRNIVIGLCAWM